VQALTCLPIADLSTLFKSLIHRGSLAITPSGLVYLSVDDDFIYRAFAQLADSQAVLPDYFNDPYLGAHISIIYPEEHKLTSIENEGTCYPFTLIGLASMVIFPKRYYFLQVQAPDLMSLRRSFGLSDKLLFKNHWIDLHITVGYTLLQR
jgi:hypothetical protein